MTRFQSVPVAGLDVFYRESGPADAPIVLALHGFPSSSRMWQPLVDRLGDRYRVVAPDLPGFGHSSAPAAGEYDYTFEHLTDAVEAFTEALGMARYTLLVQDYGGPVGMRLAQRHPDRLSALIVQNAVCHDEGLGPLWDTRRAFWADREAHEAALRENFFSPAATRLRHVGGSPHPERYDPDLWTDEQAFLDRPGQRDIQTDLFFDYQTNVASYSAWQQWLRTHRPPLLVIWGRFDPSFRVEGASAYVRDVPDAEVHVLDAGHFALDEKPDEVAALIGYFLSRQR